MPKTIITANTNKKNKKIKSSSSSREQDEAGRIRRKMRCAAALKEDVVISLLIAWAEIEVVGEQAEAN